MRPPGYRASRFMNDDNSLLFDATLVTVERGEGVYPPSWHGGADPDVDQSCRCVALIVLALAWLSLLASRPADEHCSTTLARRVG